MEDVESSLRYYGNLMSKFKVIRRGFLPTALLVVVFIMLLVLLVLYSFSQNNIGYDKFIPGPTATPVNAYQDMRNKLGEVFGGEVVHDQNKSEVAYFEFDQDRIALTSYKYFPGESSFIAGFESLDWTIDLDDEVDQFVKLKPGSQTALSCAVFYGCNPKATVELKNIGGRDWAIAEYFYFPSSSYHRVYYTFDQSTSQVVYVYTRLGDVTREEMKAGVHEAHPEFLSFISEFEKAVLE